MSLLAELKRRKVFRVAAVYAVVAWLLIQVADTLAPLMNLPEAAPRFALFALLILFPVALVLAWAYELTPQGLRLDTDAPRTDPGEPTRSSWPMLLVVGTALLAGIGLYTHNRADVPPGSEAVAPSRGPVSDKSIAVLPFTAFSSAANDQFFADGLSDTLLNKLAQLSDIKVISRSSSFLYRGDAVDVRQVGQELQVATVLEGSVQRSGNRLRVIAQLIDATTGGHIWSETFDRDGEDIFAIHDEIADAVVENLEVNLSPDEQLRLQSSGTRSVEAYNLLTALSAREQDIEGSEISAERFKQQQYASIRETSRVLELDPGYAEAFRFIAGIYSRLLFQAPNPDDDEYHLRKGFEALDRAMLLEPDNARNFSLFASLSRRAEDDVTAEAFARMARARAPNDIRPIVELSLALLAQSKNPSEAMALVDLEEALDPTSANLFRRKRFALEQLGRLEAAVEVVYAERAGTDQLQLVADDLVDVLALNLGRHVEAADALIDIRDELGETVGDRFLFGWLRLAAWLQLTEQLVSLTPRLESDEQRALFSSLATAQSSDLSAAHRELMGYSGASRAVSSALAEQCLTLGDYACAVDYALQARPELDTRNGREPSLIGFGDLQLAIHLAHSLRRLGATDAGGRLLTAAQEWYAAHAADGYVFASFYYRAELFLLTGDRDRAIDLIRQSIEREGGDFIPQCNFCSFESSLYDSVRDNAEFQALIAEYEQRRAAAAASVRALIGAAGY